MRYLWLTLAIVFCVALTAYGGEDGDEEPQAPPAESDTGAVTEEAFKSLHELREDEVPALEGEMVEVAGARAYLSVPKTFAAPRPAVVVIHEWWGLNDHIKHWADRLASDGYAALAVDLYGGEVAKTPDEAMALMRAVDGERAHAILAAAQDFLASDARVKAERRGVIGWCFGGAWSLRTALTGADLQACVLYYGRLVTDPQQLGKVKAPVLGVFGNEDRSIPPARVDEFEKALGEAGVTHLIRRYDAPHAFANPSSARYQQAEAAEAWGEVRAFLRRYLKGETESR